MREPLIAAACAVVLMAGVWLVMIVAATRLPDGAARDLARLLPDSVTMVRRLMVDPAVPRRVKVALLVAALWVASPVDLIPEFLPVIGPLDDVVVVALALRYAARTIPRETVLAAWPGEPRMIGRLLGSRTA